MVGIVARAVVFYRRVPPAGRCNAGEVLGIYENACYAAVDVVGAGDEN